MKFSNYILFNHNIINIRDYIEIDKFYNKNQESQQIINYIKSNEDFEMEKFDSYLTMIDKWKSYKSSINDRNIYIYKLQIEYIDELQTMILTEQVTKLQANPNIIFIKEHIFY